MPATRGHGGDARQARRDVGLAGVVGAKGDYRAVRLEGEAVAAAGGDRGDAREIGRDGDMAVRPPPDERPQAATVFAGAVAATGAASGPGRTVRSPLSRSAAGAIPRSRRKGRLEVDAPEWMTAATNEFT
jgi:hypothetical protein